MKSSPPSFGSRRQEREGTLQVGLALGWGWRPGGQLLPLTEGGSWLGDLICQEQRRKGVAEVWESRGGGWDGALALLWTGQLQQLGLYCLQCHRAACPGSEACAQMPNRARWQGGSPLSAGIPSSPSTAPTGCLPAARWHPHPQYKANHLRKQPPPWLKGFWGAAISLNRGPSFGGVLACW